jgi:hypothetical protein
MAQDLPDSAALRGRLLREGHLFAWPYPNRIEKGYSPDMVRAFCMQDPEWQKLRISMKGIPTHEKLVKLRSWWHTHAREAALRTEVQVGNYLGALRRGGQLNDDNQVRKYI